MGKKKNKKKNTDKKDAPARNKLTNETYEKELRRLQVELVQIQEWVKKSKEKIVVVFEGRDGAGKGGVIKRIAERVSPRVYRIVALPALIEPQKSQFYFQRYVEQLPAGGEIVLFDRSWYNRAGVERVMGFCTQDEYEEFMRLTPNFEATLVRAGIRLIKYFFDVSHEEQERRFRQRINDPMRQWKLSPMDLESYTKWWEYTGAIDKMIAATDTEYAPWYIVRADSKKRARLNCMEHLIRQIPYKKVKFSPPELPKRNKKPKGVPDQPRFQHIVEERY